MANSEYDLTFKKATELTAGSGSVASGDKVPTIDVSADNAVVTRTVSELVTIANTYPEGAQAAVVGDKFIMMDISASNALVLRTLQDILNLINTISAGADPAALNDKLVLVDVSGANAVVTRTVQDIVDLVVESDPAITARTVAASVTLVQLNAGVTILAGVAGKSIVVTDFNVRCVGLFEALTSADIISGTTSVNVASTAQANMTDGAILFKGATGVTLGTGFNAMLPAAEGLKVFKTGADATTGTSLYVTVTYYLATAA